MVDEGSLTWFDRYRGVWIAGFAHYDETGGLPFKNHRFSSVVTFDADWRRTGGWLFPASALDRMAPCAASGGAIGPDGWLSWAQDGTRTVFTIDRRKGLVRMIELPAVTAADPRVSLPFR
jgi:hypothetical protein